MRILLFVTRFGGAVGMSNTLSLNASPVSSLTQSEHWLIVEKASADHLLENDWDLIIELSGSTNNPRCFSIQKYLFENKQKIIQDAVSRIEHLGNQRCPKTNKTVVEALDLIEGYSYWYSSGAFEKCIVRNCDCYST